MTWSCGDNRPPKVGSNIADSPIMVSNSNAKKNS
jgi:hypothetical protein